MSRMPDVGAGTGRQESSSDLRAVMNVMSFPDALFPHESVLLLIRSGRGCCEKPARADV